MTKKCSRSLYLIDDDCNQQYGKVGCSEKSLRSLQVFTNNWEIWNNDFLLTLNISLVFVMVASDFFFVYFGTTSTNGELEKKIFKVSTDCFGYFSNCHFSLCSDISTEALTGLLRFCKLFRSSFGFLQQIWTSTSLFWKIFVNFTIPKTEGLLGILVEMLLDF